ncbi:MAG: PD40 domain-containing protein, partial [Actinobacteria bacterium]|nr:PD40 domain-containing protein [Actinomycetota bacterium]
YDAATWSPHGLFAAVARGRELTAVEQDGDVRWSIARPEPVAWPRWAPSGFRIAYKSGGSLRVVVGNGRGDRLLARGVDAGVPALAWAPAAKVNLLAYADRAGRVHVVDVDTRSERWSSPPAGTTTDLAWSPDGTRLLALGRKRLRVFGGDGTALGQLRLQAPAAVAFSRRADHTFALARRLDASGSEVVLLRAEARLGRPARLFSGPGVFGDLAWSPNGRWLLATWPSADQWLFLRPGRARGQKRLVAYSAITRQFGDPRGAFPAVGGWTAPSP